MQTEPAKDSTLEHFRATASVADKRFCDDLAQKVNSAIGRAVVTPEGLFTDVDFYRRNPRMSLNLGAGYLGHRVVQNESIPEGLRQATFGEARQDIESYLGRH